MDTLAIALWITAIVEVIVLICFFVLCSNVKEIKNCLIYMKGKDFAPKFKVGDKVEAPELGKCTVCSVGEFNGKFYEYLVKQDNGGPYAQKFEEIVLKPFEE